MGTRKAKSGEGCAVTKELIILIFNSSIEEEMLEALEEAGMRYYTRIPKVQGAGEESEPRLDSHVWPGTSTIYLICIDADRKDAILTAIARMKEIHREEGVKAFVLPVSACL